jgi:putative hemolysin
LRLPAACQPGQVDVWVHPPAALRAAVLGSAAEPSPRVDPQWCGQSKHHRRGVGNPAAMYCQLSGTTPRAVAQLSTLARSIGSAARSTAMEFEQCIREDRRAIVQRGSLHVSAQYLGGALPRSLRQTVRRCPACHDARNRAPSCELGASTRYRLFPKLYALRYSPQFAPPLSAARLLLRCRPMALWLMPLAPIPQSPARPSSLGRSGSRTFSRAWAGQCHPRRRIRRARRRAAPR